MRTFFLAVLFLIPAGITLRAQQACAFTLAESQDMYDAGLIEQIPEKLASCLKSGFTRDEKLQAYKLIILAYLFDDNMEQADDYMNRFLQEYPSYQPVATDPYEFVQLKETYDTEPILTFGPVLGANMVYGMVTEQFGPYNTEVESGSYTSGNPGFQAGVQGNFRLADRLNISAELTFTHKSIDYYLEQTANNPTVEFYEQQNWIDLPVSLSYDLTGNALIPYLRVGVKPALMLGANADGESYWMVNGTQVNLRSQTYMLIGDQRNPVNLWVFAGGGIRYRVGTGYLYADLRLNMNIFNQTNGKDRFPNSDQDWVLLHASDDFRMHDLTFSVGYLISIYNPKKKVQEP